jgi:hypothetical protein
VISRLFTNISPSDCNLLRLRDTNSRTVPIWAASSLLFTGMVKVTESSLPVEAALPNRTSNAINRCLTVVNDSSSMMPTRRRADHTQNFQGNLRMLQTQRLKILSADEQ